MSQNEHHHALRATVVQGGRHARRGIRDRVSSPGDLGAVVNPALQRLVSEIVIMREWCEAYPGSRGYITARLFLGDMGR